MCPGVCEVSLLAVRFRPPGCGFSPSCLTASALPPSLLRHPLFTSLLRWSVVVALARSAESLPGCCLLWALCLSRSLGYAGFNFSLWQRCPISSVSVSLCPAVPFVVALHPVALTGACGGGLAPIFGFPSFRPLPLGWFYLGRLCWSSSSRGGFLSCCGLLAYDHFPHSAPLCLRSHGSICLSPAFLVLSHFRLPYPGVVRLLLPVSSLRSRKHTSGGSRH